MHELLNSSAFWAAAGYVAIAFISNLPKPGTDKFPWYEWLYDSLTSLANRQGNKSHNP